MNGRQAVWTCVAALVAAAVFGVWWHARGRPLPLAQRVAAPMSGEPHTMLWAWETPDDFRGLKAERAGVAFLAGEVVLSQTVHVRSRRESVVIPPEVWTMAVVRLEPAAAFHDSATLRRDAVRAVLDTAARPGVRGVQIDFDAGASQRDFYAAVIRGVRASLPVQMPLSLTALVSWCGRESWLAALPVEEAVPMFFRMGGPRGMAATMARSQDGVRATVCAGAVGVSTDESWPAIGAAQRVYVFHDGPWTSAEQMRVNAAGASGLR